MKIILTILLIVVSLVSFAQQKRDTIYYTPFGEITKQRDLAKYYRVIVKENDLFHISEYDIKTDSLRKTGAFKDYEQTVKEGQFIEYKNGIPSSKDNYIEGKKNGQSSTYYDSGELFYTEDYVNGIKEGYLIAYYKDGKLKRKEKYEIGKMKSGVCYLHSGEETTYFEFMTPARFPNDKAGLIKYLTENVKYPEEAMKKGVSGKVYVQFVISKTGEIRDVKIKKSVDLLLDEEALRVVKAMPKWIPGTLDGEGVDSYFSLPISFSL